MAGDSEKPSTETQADSEPSETPPIIESPPISPADKVKEPLAAEKCRPLASEPVSPTLTLPASPRFVMAAAAFMVLTAAVGGVFGGLAIRVVPKNDTAVYERERMQHSLAQLTKEIVNLKTELAAADKNARAQTARVAELGAALKEKFVRDQTIVTGSIAAAASAPAATPTPTSPIAPAQAAPLPPPRPTSLEASNHDRDGIAEGWTVLGARRGFVYVQSGRDVYRVIRGDRLPGLGIVEDVRRDELGWVVVTHRGLIVAARERF